MWPSVTAACRRRRVTEVAARGDVAVFSTSVVLLSDPRMSLVSMANSGRISKRPILPASRAGPARTRPRGGEPERRRARSTLVPITAGYTRRAVHGATLPGDPSVVAGGGLDGRPAPAVGGPGGAHQHIAQLAQLGRPGPFVERGGDIFGRTSHLVNAVRQVGRVVGRQHHRVCRQRPGLAPVQGGTLLVGPLTARLPAVLAATAHAGVGHVSTAPAARLGVGPAGHAADFSRPRSPSPVSLMFASRMPRVGLGTTQTVITFAKRTRIAPQPRGSIRSSTHG
jgi:hypothetical protein